MVEMITFSFDKFFGIFAWQRTQASSFAGKTKGQKRFQYGNCVIVLSWHLLAVPRGKLAFNLGVYLEMNAICLKNYEIDSNIE